MFMFLRAEAPAVCTCMTCQGMRGVARQPQLACRQREYVCSDKRAISPCGRGVRLGVGLPSTVQMGGTCSARRFAHGKLSACHEAQMLKSGHGSAAAAHSCARHARRLCDAACTPLCRHVLQLLTVAGLYTCCACEHPADSSSSTASTPVLLGSYASVNACRHVNEWTWRRCCDAVSRSPCARLCSAACTPLCRSAAHPSACCSAPH